MTKPNDGMTRTNSTSILDSVTLISPSFVLSILRLRHFLAPYRGGVDPAANAELQ